jgi:hypothetical protein
MKEVLRAVPQLAEVGRQGQRRAGRKIFSPKADFSSTSLRVNYCIKITCQEEEPMRPFGPLFLRNFIDPS